VTGETRAVETLAFVDAIEAGRARLLIGEEAFSLPVTALPADAREGSWIRLSTTVVPAPPDAGDALRKRLGADDPGGDLKL
jgi:hypothetical protein